MQVKTISSWTLMFSLLSAVTYWVLAPQDGGKEALAYDKGYRHAIVVPREELRASIWQRLLTRLIQKDLVCPVNAMQFAHLSAQYDVETENITVGGDTVTLLKIDRDTEERGEIMKYLRKENGITGRTVVSSRSWYYLVFSGTVS